MHDPHPSAGSRLAVAREKAERLYRSHRARKTALIVAVILIVFGLLGFFAAPPIIKSQLQTRLTAMLGRPVSVGRVHLDPYTLRLQLDRVHIPDRDGRAPFVDVDQMVINASWTSLFHMAPVLDALSLQRPQLHLARTAPQQFNFSDILARLRSNPSKPDDEPARFSVSNISVHDGDITFDDAVTHAAHHIDHLELGIPFIANLPHDTDVFVQPL
ncbi:MAG TPA: AsmA family protein, partial [Rhodanobacteraceae bacterium]|nr:AsmA family protein [Rhodanobacteraceae bacterium]